MAENPPDAKELGFYFSLAQVGLEMVTPMCVGITLDYYLDWRPWATVVGLIVGFVGGITHMIVMVSRHDYSGPSKPRGESQ
jgi:F0F1-type ATP synthase assembly protein I